MRNEAAFEEVPRGARRRTRDERRRAFFSSQSAGQRESEASTGTSPARSLKPARNNCLFLGPSGAGKTALLTPLGQACAMAGSQELALLPHDDLAALTAEAEAYRYGAGDWKPTRATTTYSFQLRAGADSSS